MEITQRRRTSQYTSAVIEDAFENMSEMPIWRRALHGISRYPFSATLLLALGSSVLYKIFKVSKNRRIIHKIGKLYFDCHDSDKTLSERDILYVKKHNHIICTYYQCMVQQLEKMKESYENNTSFSALLTSTKTKRKNIIELRYAVNQLYFISNWDPECTWHNSTLSRELQNAGVKHNCGETFDVFMPNMKDILHSSKRFKKWTRKRNHKSDICTCGLVFNCAFYLFENETALSYFEQNKLPRLLDPENTNISSFKSKHYLKFSFKYKLRMNRDNISLSNVSIYAPQGYIKYSEKEKND